MSAEGVVTPSDRALPFTSRLHAESFCLGARGPATPTLFTVHLAQPLATHPDPVASVTVAGQHLPALIAALHEVGERAPTPCWPPVRGNAWRVSPAAAGGLTLTGPLVLHGVTEGAADDLPVRAIHVEYRHLWSLRVTVGDHP